MKGSFFNRLKNDSGQVLVLFALLMIVIMGFGALAVDIGMTTVAKSRLQNIADAAALSGAMDIQKGKSAAEQAAIDIAKSNDSNLEDSKIHPTADLDIGVVYAEADSANRTVEVIVTKKISYTFAKFLGYSDNEVSAKAVAKNPKKQWSGDALPFLNIVDDYEVGNPTVWTNIGPGMKGVITDFYTKGSGANTYFEVEYGDGVTVTPGFSNGTKGLDGSKLMDGVAKILTLEGINTKKVYVLSLSSEVINSGEFLVTRKNKTEKVKISKLNSDLKNGDVIQPHQLVLIECYYTDYDWSSNKHNIKLNTTGNVYDLGNNNPDNPLPDYPEDYTVPGGSGGISVLVE